MTTPAYVDAVAVAEHFGVSRDAVYDMARSGRVPCYRFGRVYRFDLEEVTKALRQEGGPQQHPAPKTPRGSRTKPRPGDIPPARW